MPDMIKKSIDQFSQQMEKLFGSHLLKVIVYGSYARGNYQDDSDVDVMVLVNLSETEIKKFENDVYDIAFEIEMGMGIDISPIIKSKAQYEYWVDVLPFYQNVLEEGVAVSEL
ncbi:MAG: nucleotidyltransferase domain-containing protein [Bacteroidales bacterium]|nr:nucleotidyltransferase domain-containing protein [Bacteroidales bacterium]MCM1416076.1 nucleotidyltransferase domain-containing protein [bacterium]MCM1422787.1 nucleotidyltransferase domain-containing protein [bacterium]